VIGRNLAACLRALTMSVAASATGSVTQVTRPMRPCQEFEHTSWVEDIIHLPGGQPALDHTKLHPIVHERPEVVYHSPSASTQSSSRLKAKDLAEQDPANFFSYFVCEEREDAADAVSEKHDQLKKVWWWWNLEYTPQAVFYQDDDDAHDVVVHK